MRRNRTEGRFVVYLDKTWCNTHDTKEVEQDKTCKDGTIGGPAGLVYFISLQMISYLLTGSHLERENGLLYYM